MHKADIIIGYKRDRIFRPLSNPYSDFPVPSLLFYVALIPPPKGEWGIRLPHRVYYWQTGKPGMDDSFTSNNADAVRFPVYIQEEVWQIAPV